MNSRTRAMRVGAVGAITALALPACSGSQTGGDEELGFTDEPVTLNVNWCGNDKRSELTNQMIELFEEKPPNITFSPRHRTTTRTGQARNACRGRQRARRLWVLDFTTSLTNISGQELEFGSPGTEGRENAGYTGFFWRGPRSFEDGKVHTIDLGSQQAIGTRSPWLSYSSWNDETEGGCTPLYIGGSTSPGEITWVRAKRSDRGGQSLAGIQRGLLGEGR